MTTKLKRDKVPKTEGPIVSKKQHAVKKNSKPVSISTRQLFERPGTGTGTTHTRLSKMKARGSKLEVYNGEARRTAGGLTKNDLIKNTRGKVVSAKQRAAGMKAAARLMEARKQRQASAKKSLDELRKQKGKQKKKHRPKSYDPPPQISTQPAVKTIPGPSEEKLRQQAELARLRTKKKQMQKRVAESNALREEMVKREAKKKADSIEEEKRKRKEIRERASRGEKEPVEPKKQQAKRASKKRSSPAKKKPLRKGNKIRLPNMKMVSADGPTVRKLVRRGFKLTNGKWWMPSPATGNRIMYDGPTFKKLSRGDSEWRWDHGKMEFIPFETYLPRAIGDHSFRGESTRDDESYAGADSTRKAEAKKISKKIQKIEKVNKEIERLKREIMEETGTDEDIAEDLTTFFSSGDLAEHH